MKMLLFVGAGASVELGVPAMRSMAEQFTDHLREHSSESVTVTQVARRLNESSYDMEHLIEELDNIIKGVATSAVWGIDVPSAPTADVAIMRQEAEWFVLHVCERLQPYRAKRLWVPVLRAAASHELTIATTNYDRAIEVAARELAIPMTDGFAGFAGREFADWCGFDEPRDVRLLKLHGSTDWYHTADGASVVKLRHPMPLFGQLTLSLNVPGAPQLASAAVLPSREKKVTQAPYPSIAYEFQRGARDADVAVFVGTSLRDPDIRGVCGTCSARIPTFLVSPRASNASATVPSGVKVLRQTASRFLIASLPSYLRTQELDRLGSSGDGEEEPLNVLELMAVAGDGSRPTQERSAAVERLASGRITLQKEEVEELLRDADPEVRLFALALIPDSPARAELVEIARAMADAQPDSAFAKELHLLTDMIRDLGGS